MTQAENSVTNAQNQAAREKRQEQAKARDRAWAEKNARFGGCKI